MNSNLMTEPKAAIILPTYNGEKYLVQFIDSLINQTYQNILIYTHDDGSSDNTNSIISDYAKKYPEKFVVIDGASTGGAKKNFMFLLKQVKENYLLFADQDDIWLPNKIQQTMDKMLETENGNNDIPTLIHTDLKFVNADLSLIAKSYYAYKNKKAENISFFQLLNNNLFVGCTLMINRSLIDKANKYDNINNIYMHDWWVGLLASLFGRIGFVNEQTLLYRQHEENAEGSRMNKTKLQRVLRWLHIKKMIDIRKQLKNNKIFFCKELSKHIDKSCEYYDLINGLADIQNKKKSERFAFYKKFGLLEKDKNMLWQYIWI